MLDIKFIRENIDLIKDNCTKRRVKVDIDKLLAHDAKRREILTEVETLRSERNKKSKDKPTPEEIIKMKQVGYKIKELDTELAEVEKKYKEILMSVPNLTHPSAPIGGEEDFKIVHESKTTPPNFAFTPKDHEELMTSLDLIDFERGAKVAASKFYYVKNQQVKLNMALLNYGMDVLTKRGFVLVETPDLAKDEILLGSGYNPRGSETQIYSIENSDLSLIGTAEITMGGYHANEILDLSKGPIKYAAISHCYRTEAGSYGRTSKGLYRVHQFTKLEMFVFCKPEDSERLHLEIVEAEREIVEGLGLPFRIIDIPSGDLGGPAYRKFDGETWMVLKGDGKGKQGDYTELTSCSNCTDYQARRLNIKYRADNGNVEYCHMLNGTAVVLSRFPLAVAENYQQADGSIKVPEVLQKFMGCDVIK